VLNTTTILSAAIEKRARLIVIDHVCEQCNGEPDGQERLRLIGTGDDAEEVWLHPQCWSFWCGYRGAVLSNRPNGAPPKVQSQPPTGRPST
jgi:hypothetical protein